MVSIENSPGLPIADTDDATPGGLPGIGGTDGFGGFGRSFLSGPVGRGQTNNADDVFQASQFLSENGILPAPTRQADEPFIRGLEEGQKRLNDLAGGGLTIDGIVKPWGPTEVLIQRAVSAGKLKSPMIDMEDTPRPRSPMIRPGASPRPVLPPPYRSIDGKEAPETSIRPGAAKPGTAPGLQDKLGDLIALLQKRQYQGEFQTDKEGNLRMDLPLIDLREDTLERMTRVIDNLISLFTLFRSPTIVTPTAEDPHGDKGRT
ncbi:MAG: hypothetical protein RIC82_06785 [Parvibaculum sp.]